MAKHTGTAIGLQYMPVGASKFIPWKDDMSQVMMNVVGQQKYWKVRGIETEVWPKADGVNIKVISRSTEPLEHPHQVIPGKGEKVKMKRSSPKDNPAERSDRTGFGKRASLIRIWSEAYTHSLQCYNPEEAAKIADQSIEIYENAVIRIDTMLRAEVEEARAKSNGSNH